MARQAARFVALTSALLPLASLSALPARPAPPVYATANYGLTFRTPPGLTYCPLPRDWVGSDHGTVLFLESPGNCGGAGYPSSSRSFGRDAARIELFYVYLAWDNPAPLPRCPGTRVRFINRLRPICMDRQGARVRAELRTRYDIGHGSEPGEAVLGLVTRPERLRRDLAVFRRLAVTLRTCSSIWPGASGHRPSIVGVGPRCPRVDWF